MLAQAENCISPKNRWFITPAKKRKEWLEKNNLNYGLARTLWANLPNSVKSVWISQV